MKFVTQAELGALLEREYGRDAYVLFDTPEEMQRRLAMQPPQENEIWFLDHNTNKVRMGSNRLFDVHMHNFGGYTLPYVHEEPNISDPRLRVVGQLRVALNLLGQVRVNTRTSIDGDSFWQAAQASASNPTQVKQDPVVIRERFLHWNPQRIAGFVRVYLVEDASDLAPGEEFVSLEALKNSTSDGRTLAALAALGL